MALTKLTTNSIKDSEVKTADINALAVTEAKLAADSVTTGKILDGTVAVADLATAQDWSSKTITLPVGAFNKQNFNVSLLGFKMAVNDSITVFNLVDGVVDEFHSEAGNDEAESSNDTYCASSDWYINSTQPDGAPSCTSYSAGFGAANNQSAITEPDTSTAGTNPAQGTICRAVFTVPAGMTSLNMKVWGAGGGTGNSGQNGGGGGYSEGTAAVTATQALSVYVAEGGGGDAEGAPSPPTTLNGGGVGGGFGTGPETGGGGGGGGVFSGATASSDAIAYPADIPLLFVAAGSGGGAGELTSGGSGGGLTGNVGGSEPGTEQSSENGGNGGGGSPGSGGQGGDGSPMQAPGGGYFAGGPGHPASGGNGGGGAGWRSGGGGHAERAGGGGAGYYGHPQVTSGSSEDGEGTGSGGQTVPGFVPETGGAASYATGSLDPSNIPGTEPDGGYVGEEGYILITGCAAVSASAITTNIISNAFTAGTAPATARIVVFQENVDTPTLNTDIIASISRDGGTTFTTATLADSGYVAGTSGQRILTGTATVSGQPSGTAMRWKLALANNQVKVHGVSLAWA